MGENCFVLGSQHYTVVMEKVKIIDAVGRG